MSPFCQWFWGAYLGWEHNGPGAAFTKRITKLNYGNVYRRKSQSKRGGKVTKELGWWTDDKTKQVMFSEIARAVRMGDVIIRSAELKKELGQYVYLNGKIEHAASLTTEDSSARGKAHGDRVIGFGVVLQCAIDRPTQVAASAPSNKTPPPGTMAERMAAYAREDEQEHDPDEWYPSVVESLGGR